MIHKKDWGPGWRYFDCETCGTMWKEKSRDCTSPSSVPCKNTECEDMYGISPFGHVKRYEWPTDKSGNLLDE